MAAWYFTKEGLNRLDQPHINIAYICLGALIAAIPWERRWMPVGVVGLALAPIAVVATTRTIGTYAQVRDLVVEQPRHELGEAARILRSTAEPAFRSHELQAARRSIQARYRIPDPVVRELNGANVAADPWAIAAIWAYHLRWRPVPVFQPYAAYTPALDELNSDSLRSRSGPNAVLRQSGFFGPLLFDKRFAAWDSPSYNVTLTCSYETLGEPAEWQALERTSNACGQPRLISEKLLHARGTTVVPTAQNPNDLIVATFDYPNSTIEQLGTFLLTPSRRPTVVLDGSPYRFVPGTASQEHLVHVPATIAKRGIANAGLDIRRISFPNAGGPVRVRFYELATQ
jgi:hypothetical protein